MNIIKTFFCSLAIFWTGVAVAQYQSVIFNYEKSQFNDGRALPAETYFILSGAVSQQVSMVEVKFYAKHSDEDKDALYSKLWKREFSNKTDRFELPINYKLRGDSEYDIYINYYRLSSNGELRNVRDELFYSLDSYIDQNLELNKKSISLLKNSGRMVEDLNSIVSSAMSFYRSPLESGFDGFSDLVLDKIDLIENKKQNKILGRKSTEEENIALKDKNISELKIRVHSELAHLFNSRLSVVADIKFIDDYKVEKVRNIITLHGGLGGTYLEGDIDNNTFGSSGMAGITLPLGKMAFSSNFWSRSAIMMGVYFKNFEGSNSTEITGPIINRPVYVGLGYKLFQFVRLTGGVTVLENKGSSTSISDIKDNIYVRPYIGITADLNLWLDLGK